MNRLVKYLTVVLVIVTSTVVTSCGKKDPGPQPTPSKSKMTLLTQKAWININIEKLKNGVWVNDFGTPPTTALDDQYVFKSNGDFELNEGPTKASGSSQIIDTGKWIFVENETKIQIVGNDLIEIIELTDDKLQFKVLSSVPERWTFKHP